MNQLPSTVHCSVPDATVEISHLGRYFKDMHEATVRLTRGTLKEGDRISLVIGDRTEGGPGTVVVPHAHRDRPLRIASDVDGDGEFSPLASWLEVTVAPAPAVRFELVAPVPFSTVCFRARMPGGAGMDDGGRADEWNRELLTRVNRRGPVFLSHTVLGGRYTLRLAVGSVHTASRNVDEAYRLLCEEHDAMAAALDVGGEVSA